MELSRLAAGSVDAWEVLARGRTNADGRVGDLLPPGPLVPGTYRMAFGVKEYALGLHAAVPGFFAAEPFYPHAAIPFTVTEAQTNAHFHVPLTWNPYGYSTYRGS